MYKNLKRAKVFVIFFDYLIKMFYIYTVSDTLVLGAGPLTNEKL